MSVDTLQMRIRKRKNPTAVRLDLRADLLPPGLLADAVAAHGETAGALAEACGSFGIGILDALADVVPAVIFNTAYYDAMGAAGAALLQRLCAHAEKRNYYVILETMRSDLEAAAELCAQTYFGALQIGETQTALYGADALCIGAFTGSDGVRPYLPYCRDREKSLFLLARTANKSAREVQDLISGDRVIHTVMTDLAVRWGAVLLGKCGYSQVGVVVSAAGAGLLQELRRRYDRLFFLVSGYGVPGSMAKDVQYAFDQLGHGAVVAASDGIAGAWRKAGSGGLDFAEQARTAAERMRDEIARYVTVR